MRLFRQTVRVTETRHHICAAIFEMDANRGRFTQEKTQMILSVYTFSTYTVTTEFSKCCISSLREITKTGSRKIE